MSSLGFPAIQALHGAATLAASGGSAGLGFYTTKMLHGALVTLELTAVGTGVSLIVGAIFALGRMRGPAPVRYLVTGYVELVRGVPQILQLFIFYFGLTQFGVYLSALTAGFIWMCVYGTGYAVEIFRAGFAGVAHGQEEAATAIGLGRLSSMRRVILPQVVAAMLPPLTSFVILQLKNTTLVYIIGVHEIMFNARVGAGATFRPLVIYAIAAGIYLAMNWVLARSAGWWQQHRMRWAR